MPYLSCRCHVVVVVGTGFPGVTWQCWTFKKKKNTRNNKIRYNLKVYQRHKEQLIIIDVGPHSMGQRSCYPSYIFFRYTLEAVPIKDDSQETTREVWKNLSNHYLSTYIRYWCINSNDVGFGPIRKTLNKLTLYSISKLAIGFYSTTIFFVWQRHKRTASDHVHEI